MMLRLEHILVSLFCAAMLALGGARTAHALPDLSEIPLDVYKPEAAKAWRSAERAFRSGDYIESIRRYNLLRTRFPYSGLSTLADLRIADAYFEQEKYATAVEQYRAFIKLHAQHERVPFAAWRVALAFASQMPRDSIWLPPGYERDLRRAEEAVRELGYFLRRYPNTEWEDEAVQLLLSSKRRLADHELYVASYYFNRENPRAAALRLTYLLKNYQGLGLDPEALFLLGRAYMELGDVEKARVALTDLIEVHPSNDLAKKAKAYMDEYGLELATN